MTTYLARNNRLKLPNLLQMRIFSLLKMLTDGLECIIVMFLSAV